MSNHLPSYCRYAKHYARVRIDGRNIHLGKYGSPESKAKYKRLIAQQAAGSPVVQRDDGVLIGELLESYRTWAAHHYGDVPRGRYRELLPTIRTVRELFADLPADQFSPKRLKVARAAFAARGNSRGHVNTCTRRVIAIFRWAAEEELVPGSLVESLKQVRPLEYGRCELPEGERVAPVSQDDVDPLPHLSGIVADMVRLQLLTGARPAEICQLTPAAVDRTGDVWLYRPAHHKTRHHGHDRVIAIGPRGQDVLRPYLLHAPDAPCFSSQEALRTHLEARHDERVTPMNEGHKPVPAKRRAALAKCGDQYDVASYRRAIHPRHACVPG